MASAADSNARSSVSSVAAEVAGASFVLEDPFQDDDFVAAFQAAYLVVAYLDGFVAAVFAFVVVAGAVAMDVRAVFVGYCGRRRAS